MPLFGGAAIVNMWAMGMFSPKNKKEAPKKKKKKKKK